MNRIPKIIHQFSMEKEYDVAEELYYAMQDSWKNYNPKWQYKVWNKRMVEECIQQQYPYLIKLLMSDVLMSDIARYVILHSEGGIFVNGDFECIDSFDEIIHGKHCCLSYAPSNSTDSIMSDSLIISEKAHPFLSYIISSLNGNVDLLKKSRDHFINAVYNQYSDKDSVEILPSDMINPCTKDEIMLYKHGLLPDEEMEYKISNAVCVCYYCERLPMQNNAVAETMQTDVLYLSSVVGNGGAPRAAHRIHLGLRSIGINSKMLTLSSSLNPKDHKPDEIHVARPQQGEVCGRTNDMRVMKNYPKATHLFSPAVVGIDINRYIDEYNPKIVQMHWINGGFIKVEDIGKINRKIVWRLPDCWAFTGGCYYFGDCARYQTGCGKCPKLGSVDENDLSHDIWVRKKQAWSNLDMAMVVPTLWMKQVAQESVLLEGRNFEVIPNGLNLREFYPVDKTIARKALGIPQNKKIILYGAANALSDPRKGFHKLKETLSLLSEDYKDEYCLVIFGAPYQELDLKIQVKFLGVIKQHYMLQLAYSSADVMIVPSLEEAFGQTVTEAMACATPVISFLDTGPASIIDHKQNGYLARYADPVDMADGIKWVLSDDELIKVLSQAARYKVETTYDIKVVARQYQELYEKILQ